MIPEVLKNRYRTLHSLSSGGFGETFLAKDMDSPTNRCCVIKQLKPIANDPQTYQTVQERFQREAVILEDLGHGHSQIPALYAYFELDGQFYLVEEYIEGATLSEKLQQSGKFSESSVRELLLGILPVLHHMHGKGIIHRDIKPDNIILRNKDNQPVLIDLGAVKETMNTTVAASNNSTHSIVIGTPGFMPSEQSIGRPVFSSDLYSLGLTAIYLLTGKAPQELHSDPMTGAIAWRQETSAIEPTLAAILDKAIQPHSRDRYHTVPEMLNALQTGTAPSSTPIPSTVASNNIPGTVVSPPPQQPPTVFSTPPSTVQQPASTGLSDWQKAMMTGSIVGIFVVVALVATRPQTSSSSNSNTNGNNTEEVNNTNNQNNANDNNNVTNNNNLTNNDNVANNNNIETQPFNPPPSPVLQTPYVPPSPQPDYNPPPASISQQQAVNVIQKWQNYKRQIFSPPYKRSLGGQVLTGKAYWENISRSDGQESSVDWLANNNAYYSYGVQRVDRVDKLVSSGNQATLDVVITEQRSLYKNGRRSNQESALDTRLVRYSLQLENGQWKIADYDTLKVLSSQ